MLRDFAKPWGPNGCNMDGGGIPRWRHQMETFSASLALYAGIHRLPVNFPPIGQWRGALKCSLICAWINGWVSNREADDSRRHRAHYDVTVMPHFKEWCTYTTIVVVDFPFVLTSWFIDQAPVPLSIFRSNSKFDENSKHSGVKYARPITTIFCTRHDSVTVVMCEKYRCDWSSIFETWAFWIFIEFRIRSKYA